MTIMQKSILTCKIEEVLTISYNIIAKDFVADDSSFHLACANCNRFLGVCFYKSYFISRKKIRNKPYFLNISIFSLSEKLITNFEEPLNKCLNKLALQTHISKKILRKSELQKFESDDKECDISIVIHMNVGRLLLTDENGLYNKLIRAEYAKTSSQFISNSQAATSC